FQFAGLRVGQGPFGRRLKVPAVLLERPVSTEMLLKTKGATLISACGLSIWIGLEASAANYGQQPAAETTRSICDGVCTEEQDKRGEQVYKKECAACHADALVGGGGAAPLSGGTFLSNWNGLTLGDLYDRIRKTMPQGSPGKLNKQQNADVLAY